MSCAALTNVEPGFRAEPLVLVEEIGHRVVNEYTEAIAGIALAAAGTTDPAAQAALRAAARRLRAYADAHKALQPPTAERFELGEYLRTVCSALSIARLDARGIRLTLVEDVVCLPADSCWRIGLIVAELVTNAVRHAFAGGPGSILVELSARPDQLLCRVVDDGSSKAAPPEGRGRRLVRGLAESLGASVAWSFGPGGAQAVLVLPFTAPGARRA